MCRINACARKHGVCRCLLKSDMMKYKNLCADELNAKWKVDALNVFLIQLGSSETMMNITCS